MGMENILRAALKFRVKMGHFVVACFCLNRESANFGQDEPGRSPTPLQDTHT